MAPPLFSDQPIILVSPTDCKTLCRPEKLLFSLLIDMHRISCFYSLSLFCCQNFSASPGAPSPLSLRGHFVFISFFGVCPSARGRGRSLAVSLIRMLGWLHLSAEDHRRHYQLLRKLINNSGRRRTISAAVPHSSLSLAPLAFTLADTRIDTHIDTHRNSAIQPRPTTW